MRAVARSINVSPHDLLRVGGAGDLRITQAPPAWVSVSLERVSWVVVRRSSPLEGMVPVGVRGSSREQRFAAYLPVEAILDRVTPEELARHESWRKSSRRREVPALQDLDSVSQIMSDLGLHWGPTGSVGFEIATGFPAAKRNSDLDLLIRAPYELARDLCRCVWIRLSDQVAVRTDVLIETGAGAVGLYEYMRGDLPIMFRSSPGPKLVYRPWEIVDECCLHISRAGIPGAGDVTFSSESSCGSPHAG